MSQKKCRFLSYLPGQSPKIASMTAHKEGNHQTKRPTIGMSLLRAGTIKASVHSIPPAIMPNNKMKAHRCLLKRIGRKRNTVRTTRVTMRCCMSLCGILEKIDLGETRARRGERRRVLDKVFQVDFESRGKGSIGYPHSLTHLLSCFSNHYAKREPLTLHTSAP